MLWTVRAVFAPVADLDAMEDLLSAQLAEATVKGLTHERADARLTMYFQVALGAQEETNDPLTAEIERAILPLLPADAELKSLLLDAPKSPTC